MKQLDKKGLKKLHKWIRAIIQLLYFLFLPSAYTAAFAGVKYIFTQIGNGARVELTSFVTVLIVLCVYTVVFGRFFCGFACAFGSLGDAVHALYVWICKKLKKKPVKLNQKLTGVLSCMKYVVLAVIVILCFAGFFGKTQGTSPWEVFSMLHAGNFKLAGYGIGILFSGADHHWYVSAGALFLPFPLPDGSHIFYFTGASGIFPAQGSGTVSERLQRLHQNVSVRY